MKIDPRLPSDQSEDWQAGWEEHRQRQLTSGLAVSPAERLQWLEEMIAVAHQVGALPRKRDDR